MNLIVIFVNTVTIFSFPFVPQLAEYRQRKAYADSQKKQKKKKKKKAAEDSEGDSQGRVDVELDQPEGGEEASGEGRDGSEKGTKDPRTTEFTFAKTLQSGEIVKHDQTYTIEVESYNLAPCTLSV